jgi:flagellar hook assembly protein FlgD
VAERIETTGGAVIRKLGTVTTGPGPLTVTWDGKAASGASVYGGRYVAHVTAQSAIGTSDLSATFNVRRK